MSDCVKGARMCLEFLRSSCGLRQDEVKRYANLDNVRPYSTAAGWYEISLGRKKEDWDCGYHGTPTGNVGSIIRSGLIKPGDKTVDGTVITTPSWHIQGMKFIFTSPSLYCSGHNAYARETGFVFEGKPYYVRTVFRVRQRPGSYKVQKNTLDERCWDPNVRMDDAFNNNELERVTDDPGAVILESLLMNFSDIPISQVYALRQIEQRRKCH